MFVNDHAYIIIGGSTKCATTSVFSYLADHPQISGSKIKESRFFWKGDYELKKVGVNIDDGIAAYDSVFADKVNSKYRLEATPDYLYSDTTSHLIKSNLNDVRFIFIIRDPIERVISWFKFAKQLDLINADETINDFILNQLDLDTKLKRPQYLHSIEQGCYANYLNNYIENFGADKVMIINYNCLTSNPMETIIDVCKFLRIDSSFYTVYDFKVLNQSVNVANVKSFVKYRDLRRKVRRVFKNLIPAKLIKPFSKVFKRVDNIYMKNTTSSFDEIKIDDELRARLINYYASDQELLAAIKKV